MSRNAMFVLGLVASVLAYVGNETGAFPEAWHPWVSLAGIVGTALNAALWQVRGQAQPEKPPSVTRGPFDRPGGNAAAIALLAIGLMAASCAPAIVATNPALSEVGQARDLGGRFADATALGLRTIDDLGASLAQLPVSTATKDDYDCAILKVVGTNGEPSATVTRVCGTVPTSERAPLVLAMRAMRDVTSCASLRSTVAVVMGAVDPLILKLSQSTNATLSLAATTIRTAFGFARQFLEGGGTCASH